MNKKDRCPNCNSPLTKAEWEVYYLGGVEEYFICKKCKVIEPRGVISARATRENENIR